MKLPNIVFLTKLDCLFGKHQLCEPISLAQIYFFKRLLQQMVFNINYLWRMKIEDVVNFEIYEDDVWIVTPPKCGTTWWAKNWNYHWPTYLSIYLIKGWWWWYATKLQAEQMLLNQPVWPDWVIYWNLGNFLKPLATINLPKYPHIIRHFL